MYSHIYNYVYIYICGAALPFEHHICICGTYTPSHMYMWRACEFVCVCVCVRGQRIGVFRALSSPSPLTWNLEESES